MKKWILCLALVTASVTGCSKKSEPDAETEQKAMLEHAKQHYVFLARKQLGGGEWQVQSVEKVDGQASSADGVEEYALKFRAKAVATRDTKPLLKSSPAIKAGQTDSYEGVVRFARTEKGWVWQKPDSW